MKKLMKKNQKKNKKNYIFKKIKKNDKFYFQ